MVISDVKQLFSPEFAGTLLAWASPGDFGGGMPCYIVNAGDIAGQIPEQAYPASRGHCLAFAGVDLSEHLKSFLSERGRWHGPGFACVVYPDRLARQVPHSASERLTTGVGVLVHEAAHYLEQVLHPRRSRTRERLQAFIEGVAADPLLQTYHLVKGPPAAAAHGAPWIRASLHLWHRTKQLHAGLTADHCVIAGPRYGLRPPCDYAAALAGELLSLQELPITAILTNVRPPESFVRLWESDAGRHPGS